MATETEGPRRPRMRADAQRNREQLLRAARVVITEQGPEAPLEEIARRAGVGIATLYRRFPERTDLLHAVALDVLTDIHAAATAATTAEDDPFQALRRFMHAALDLRIGAFMPSVVGRIGLDDELITTQRAAMRTVSELLGRAQAAGMVRPDLVFGDIALFIARLSHPLPVPDFPGDLELAHRHLEIYVNGLRVHTAELPGPVLDAAAFGRLTQDLFDGKPEDS